MKEFPDKQSKIFLENELSSDEVVGRELYDEALMKNEAAARKFAIRKIVVHSACHERMLKILKPGEYVFSDSKFDDFFLDGITVCSVVGKNGCGKSAQLQ